MFNLFRVYIHAHIINFIVDIIFIWLVLVVVVLVLENHLMCFAPVTFCIIYACNVI